MLLCRAVAGGRVLCVGGGPHEPLHPRPAHQGAAAHRVALPRRHSAPQLHCEHPAHALRFPCLFPCLLNYNVGVRIQNPVLGFSRRGFPTVYSLFLVLLHLPCTSVPY